MAWADAAEAWTTEDAGETAQAAPIPVLADGELFAEVQPIWSDVDGVRVSVNWSADMFNGFSRLEDLSVGQALALSAVLHEAASVEPPTNV